MLATREPSTDDCLHPNQTRPERKLIFDKRQLLLILDHLHHYCHVAIGGARRQKGNPMSDHDITTDQSIVRLEITLTKNEADYLVGVLAVGNDYEILEANDRGLFEPINDIQDSSIIALLSPLTEGAEPAKVDCKQAYWY
jgi:hypothetical protein